MSEEIEEDENVDCVEGVWGGAVPPFGEGVRGGQEGLFPQRGEVSAGEGFVSDGNATGGDRGGKGGKGGPLRAHTPGIRTGEVEGPERGDKATGPLHR